MDTIPPHASRQKPPYYVYTLAYPESMGGYVFYVGKGKGNRIYEHEIYARRSSFPQSYKVNIIRKVERNGERIVRTKLHFFEDEADAFLYEVALIFFMRPYNHLANLTDGGEGAAGLTHICPEEVKRKFSEMYKGKPGQIISEDGKRRISEATKARYAQRPKRIKVRKRPEIGWHHSEETKQKLKENGLKYGFQKGNSHTEEFKQRMSERHKGKITPEETKQKMREGALGRVMSEESRRKMSEAKKGKPGPRPSEVTRKKLHEASIRREAIKRQARLQIDAEGSEA